MRAAIFSLLPVRPRSTIASVRIGAWLSETLGIPIFDDDRILEALPVDRLFIINGSTLYCKHLEALAKAVTETEDVYWIQNDYTLPAPKAFSEALSPFRKAFADRHLVPHHWTTCEINSTLTPKSRYVNWNVLGFVPGLPRAALGGCMAVYWGAYRAGRLDAFDCLYAAFAGLPLAISSTAPKFPENLRVPPFREDFYGCIAQFGAAVYLQDKKSILGKTSPATRFYEALSVGLPIIFHPDCVNTFAQYGYDVSPYIMTPQTTGEFINQRKRIADAQQSWVQDFRGDLEKFVKGIYDEHDTRLDTETETSIL